MITSKITLWRDLDSFDPKLLERTFQSYHFKLTPIATRLKHYEGEDLIDFWKNVELRSIEDKTKPSRETMERFWWSLMQGEIGPHVVYQLSYNNFKISYVVLCVGASFGPHAYMTSKINNR